MSLTKKQAASLAKLSVHGIKHPLVTMQQASAVGLDLPSACAMLLMETSGGWNEFGHDPGNTVQGGWVNKARYEQMRHGVAVGQPSQGVGPCQLTSTGLQNEADKLGGCWRIEHNMHVGFNFLKGLIAQHGHEAGFAAYNGSGESAQQYGAHAEAIRLEFERILG